MPAPCRSLQDTQPVSRDLGGLPVSLTWNVRYRTGTVKYRDANCGRSGRKGLLRRIRISEANLPARKVIEEGLLRLHESRTGDLRVNISRYTTTAGGDPSAVCFGSGRSRPHLERPSEYEVSSFVLTPDDVCSRKRERICGRVPGASIARRRGDGALRNALPKKSLQFPEAVRHHAAACLVNTFQYLRMLFCVPDPQRLRRPDHKACAIVFPTVDLVHFFIIHYMPG